MTRNICLIAILSIMLTGCAGAQLTEVRQKWKFGPEFREGSSNTHNERWTIQTGLETKWDNGWKAGVTYRRRDVNDGGGGHDNGVWIDFSYPLWKRPK
jgi:opacity protein-like surface antigen